MRKSLFFIAFIITLVSISFGCKNIQSDKGSIFIKFPGAINGRSIFTKEDVSYFSIDIEGENDSQHISHLKPGTDFKSKELEEGSYKISVSAFSEDNVYIASGETTAQIIGDETVSVSIILKFTDDPDNPEEGIEDPPIIVNFYVSSDGDDENDGTLENPLATIQKAIEKSVDEGNIYLLSDIELESTVYIDKQIMIMPALELAELGVTSISIKTSNNFVPGSTYEYKHAIYVEGSYGNPVGKLNMFNTDSCSLTLDGNNVELSEAFLGVRGNAGLYNITVKNCHSTSSTGGAISVSYGKLTLNHSYIGNPDITACPSTKAEASNYSNNGGAIYISDSGSVQMWGGKISGNYSATTGSYNGFGGAVYIEASGLSSFSMYEGSIIEFNKAENDGSAIYAYKLEYEMNDNDLQKFYRVRLNGGTIKNNFADNKSVSLGKYCHIAIGENVFAKDNSDYIYVPESAYNSVKFADTISDSDQETRIKLGYALSFDTDNAASLGDNFIFEDDCYSDVIPYITLISSEGEALVFSTIEKKVLNNTPLAYIKFGNNNIRYIYSSTDGAAIQTMLTADTADISPNLAMWNNTTMDDFITLRNTLKSITTIKQDYYSTSYIKMSLAKTAITYENINNNLQSTNNAFLRSASDDKFFNNIRYFELPESVTVIPAGLFTGWTTLEFSLENITKVEKGGIAKIKSLSVPSDSRWYVYYQNGISDLPVKIKIANYYDMYPDASDEYKTVLSAEGCYRVANAVDRSNNERTSISNNQDGTALNSGYDLDAVFELEKLILERIE